MRARDIRSLTAFAFGVALAWAAPAEAELFRCRDADGKIVFTDQKSLCPGADPFEPTGEVHAVEPTSERPAPSRAPAATAPSLDAAQQAHWRQQKLDAENELARIQKRRDWMQQYVSHCNRGGYVTTRDEAGIKQVVNCSMLRREFDALEAEEKKARDYLTTGLRDDCRRAGCLPGWIR